MQLAKAMLSLSTFGGNGLRPEISQDRLPKLSMARLSNIPLDTGRNELVQKLLIWNREIWVTELIEHLENTIQRCKVMQECRHITENKDVGKNLQSKAENKYFQKDHTSTSEAFPRIALPNRVHLMVLLLKCKNFEITKINTFGQPI